MNVFGFRVRTSARRRPIKGGFTRRVHVCVRRPRDLLHALHGVQVPGLVEARTCCLFMIDGVDDIELFFDCITDLHAMHGDFAVDFDTLGHILCELGNGRAAAAPPVDGDATMALTSWWSAACSSSKWFVEAFHRTPLWIARTTQTEQPGQAVRAFLTL